MLQIIICVYGKVLIQLMSTQKLKIFKKLKGIDNYSKNPIIDSLIKQKLQSQMIVIKDSFNQLVRKDQKQKQMENQRKPTLRRRLSTHNLGAITPQKIHSSITFHPDKFTLDFVNQRQRSSPLIEPSAVQDLNKARNSGQDLFVKLKQSDKIVYQSASIQAPAQYYSQLQDRLRKTLSSDLWLPQKPEVEQILVNRGSFQESRRQKSEMFQLALSSRQLPQSFSPLKSSREFRSKKDSRASPLTEINYQPKKYHKNDYISLEKWLQETLNSLRTDQNQSQEQKLKQKLNKIYTIYMCAMKQLIRLTYIESAQKGLLIEKLVWSQLRLFQSLIKQQHAISYREFKATAKQISEERQLFNDRMQKLENELRLKQEQYAKASQEKEDLAYTALAFKKVNQQMNTEIDSLFEELHSVKKQNDYLMANLIKIIQQFEHRQIIKVHKTQHFISYFYLSSKNKMEVIAKVDRNDKLGQHFKKEFYRVEQENKAVIKPLDKLQNELTNYWGKKRAYLDVDNIIKQHFYAQISDNSTQADGRGPFQYIDFQTQHPAQGQETFEQFLNKQLTTERESWSKKEQDYKQTQISLKELYQELRETISNLSTHNVKLKGTIDQKEHEYHILQKKTLQLQQKNSLLLKKIAALENDIVGMNQKQAKIKAEIEQRIAQYAQMKKRYMFQVQNNKILASSNFNLTQKAEDFNRQFEDLEDRIRAVAPHIEETMHLAQSSQNPTLRSLATMVEKHLSKYVEKDAKVFLTF